MRKQVYEALLKIASDEQVTSLELFKKELHTEIIKNNSDNLCLTIKNYSRNNGLSAHIHHEVGQAKLQIQGPLGTGLGIKNRGRHVAFAAGTGVLVFIDLVGHLILRLTGFTANYTEP